MNASVLTTRLEEGQDDSGEVVLYSTSGRSTVLKLLR